MTPPSVRRLPRRALRLAVFAGAFFLSHPVPAAARAEPSPVVVTPEDRKKISEFLDAAFNAYVDEDYESALMNFQRVLQVDPGDEASLNGVRQCKKRLEKTRSVQNKENQWSARQARKLLKREKWLDAIDLLNERLAKSPATPELLELQNEVVSEMKGRLSRLAPTDSRRMFYDGILLYLNQRYDDAIQVWKQAQLLLPDDYRVTIYIERAQQVRTESAEREVKTSGRARAQAAFEAGNYDEAAQLWEKVLEYYPEDAEAKEKLARAREMQNRKNRQSFIEEHYDRGLELFLKGNFAESLKDWEEILAIDPQNEVAQGYVKRIEAKGIKRSARPRGTARSEPRDSEPAPVPGTSVPPEALSRDSNETALALYRKGNYAEAVRIFGKILKNDPQDRQSSEWLEKITLEQNEKAQEHYQNGLIAYSEGNISKAIQEWEETLRIAPNHAAAQRVLNKVGGRKPR